MIWLHHLKYRRLLAVLQAANENGKNGVAVCKHPDHPQSVLFVVLLLHRPSPPPKKKKTKTKKRLTQNDMNAIEQCARSSPKKHSKTDNREV